MVNFWPQRVESITDEGRGVKKKLSIWLISGNRRIRMGTAINIEGTAAPLTGQRRTGDDKGVKERGEFSLRCQLDRGVFRKCRAA